MTDVCLILEGIYLHVRGGVSVWVDSLIRALPDLSFSILHISPSEDRGKRYVSQMPDNVVEVQEVFPFDYETTPRGSRSRRQTAQAWAEIEQIYRKIIRNEPTDYGRLIDLISGPDRVLSTHDLSFSEEAWDLVNRIYQDVAPDYSFIDFFWTWRFTHMPLMKLVDLDLPAARVYHAVATGYAGLLGAIAKQHGAERFLLTEHGIYTRERSLEISQADWIHTPEAHQPVVARHQGLFKTWWERMFGVFAAIAYQQADRIVTLFEGNRMHQLGAGADPNRTLIIPNGIPIDRFDQPRSEPERTKQIGFMGRVVPIKDIMTFIRAAKIVSDRIPEACFLIMGGTDEDPDYVAKCRQLVEVLGLEDRLTFTGVIDATEYYPKLDAVVLTSLSEGQPLSILEAMTAGVPVVATRVGACEELLTGRTAEDRALGDSGVVTNVSTPADTADGILRILSDEKLWHRMSEAGKKRTAAYYRLETVTEQYRQLYQPQMQEA